MNTAPMKPSGLTQSEIQDVSKYLADWGCLANPLVVRLLRSASLAAGGETPVYADIREAASAIYEATVHGAAPAAAAPLSSMPDLQAAVAKGLADGSLVPQGAAKAETT